MNQASAKEISRTFLHASLLMAAVSLSACSYLMPQQPAAKPARVPKPASLSDTQQRDRARQDLQKATSSSNEYSACVMFATSTHRGNRVSSSDVASAASANCASKLDDYEKSMMAYYENSPIKPSNPAASPKDRAHESRVELEQTTRDAAIRSLEKNN